MTIDLNNGTTFWIVGAVWFTVPILSWLWSLTTLYFYRNLTKLMNDATKTYEQARTMNEQMLAYRLETMELRTKAEEEIKLACSYYTRVTELVTREKNAQRDLQLKHDIL